MPGHIELKPVQIGWRAAGTATGDPRRLLVVSDPNGVIHIPAGVWLAPLTISGCDCTIMGHGALFKGDQ